MACHAACFRRQDVVSRGYAGPQAFGTVTFGALDRLVAYVQVMAELDVRCSFDGLAKDQREGKQEQ